MEVPTPSPCAAGTTPWVAEVSTLSANTGAGGWKSLVGRNAIARRSDRHRSRRRPRCTRPSGLARLHGLGALGYRSSARSLATRSLPGPARPVREHWIVYRKYQRGRYRSPMSVLCRLRAHRWQHWHYVNVYRPSLGRTVRVLSRICERCGRTEDRVVRQRPERQPWVQEDGGGGRSR